MLSQLSKYSRLQLPIGGLLLLVLPIVFPSPYVAEVMILAFTFAVLGTGLNLLFGYMGALSLAQVTFWAIGGYTAAVLSLKVGLPFVVCVVAGGLLAAAVAFVIGSQAMRLSSHSFAIFTLVLSLLTMTVANHWKSVTNGALGMYGMEQPRLTLFGLNIEFGSARNDYYLTLVVAAICCLCMWRIVASRMGRTMSAIREDAPLAISQGVHVYKYKLIVFTVVAFFTGIIGATYAFHQNYVGPAVTDFYYTQVMLAIVIVGGLGRFWPVVGAAIVLTAIPELFRPLQDYRLIGYGLMIILFTYLLPQGIGGILAQRRQKALVRKITPAVGAAQKGSRT